MEITTDRFYYYNDIYHETKDEMYEDLMKSMDTLMAYMQSGNTLEKRLAYYELVRPQISERVKAYKNKINLLRKNPNLKYFNDKLEKDEHDIDLMVGKLRRIYRELTNPTTIPSKKPERVKITPKSYKEINPIILKQKRRELISTLEETINKYEELKASRKKGKAEDAYLDHEQGIRIEGRKYLKDSLTQKREGINKQKYGAILSKLKEIKEEGRLYNMFDEVLSDGRRFEPTLEDYINRLEKKFERGTFTYRKSKKSAPTKKQKSKTRAKAKPKKAKPTFRTGKSQGRGIINNMNKITGTALKRFK